MVKFRTVGLDAFLLLRPIYLHLGTRDYSMPLLELRACSLKNGGYGLIKIDKSACNGLVRPRTLRSPSPLHSHFTKMP